MHELHRRLFLMPFDKKYDYKRMPEVIDSARYKGRISTDSTTGIKSWILNRDMLDFLTGEGNYFLGKNFQPFGGNNYLYGFNVKEAPYSLYRLLNDSTLSTHAQFVAYRQKLLRDVILKVGGVTPDKLITYVKMTKDPQVLLFAACTPDVPLEFRIYYLHQYWVINAFRLDEPNVQASWLAPLLLGTQLWNFGWKRTLTIWALGALLSEGVNTIRGGAFAGWSIILFMSYGQVLEQWYSEGKFLGKDVKSLLLRGLAAYGGYEVVVGFYKDPAPIGKASTKTGTHHGIHHLSLISGFLLNRWTR